jgi:GntR family transcriptional regulator, transcriptional repressor for pyruvate dehydrogenase complex
MKEIHRITITDEVVDNIRELIESKAYAIGEKLPTEYSFCQEMKVSRTSVREAIRVLQALGYIELRPGKGAFVANYEGGKKTYNWYEVEDAKYYDFMEVRMAIETLSVRLSVERATPKQIQELEEIYKSFEEAYKHKDQVQLIMLDELFHSKIISYTKNQLLINIDKQMVEAFRPFRSDSFTNENVYKNALEPHRKIFECFQTHNPSQAVKEMRKHLEMSVRDMGIIHNNPASLKITKQESTDLRSLKKKV